MVFTRRQSSRLAAASKNPPEERDAPVKSHIQTPGTPSHNSKLPKPTSMKKINVDSKPLPPPPASSIDGSLSFLSSLAARTPSSKSQIRPSRAEMHPQHHQISTSTPLQEARWLGFSNMDTQAAPPKVHATVEEKFAAQTPSRSSTGKKSAPLDGFEFTFRRESTVELSTEAQKMMAESREEARRIRERMIAQLPAIPTEGSGHDQAENRKAKIENVPASRKMAQAKGKAGRYSAVHMAEFKKMDSIANHPSAWRTDPSRFKNTNIVPSQIASSLKRTLSKTEAGSDDGKDLAVRPVTKPLPPPPRTAAALKRSPSKAELDKSEESPFVTRSTASFLMASGGIPVPAKRIKLTHSQEASASKSHVGGNPLPVSTLKSIGTHVSIDRPKGLSHLMTPTKSSLARANSVQSLKTTRLPMSSLMRSKSAKVTSRFRSVVVPNPPTTTMNSGPTSDSIGTSGPHTPRAHAETSVARPISPTPIKVAAAIQDDAIVAPEELITSTPVAEQSLVAKLKSCLRTPHRLYSNDPSKIAAGTHLATPPRMRHISDKIAPHTAPVRKHVDFTSSTKDKANLDEARAASIEPPQLGDVLYPQLHILEEDDDTDRRSTISSLPIPGAFTFRASSPLKFTPLPNNHPTIRQVGMSDVSADLQTSTNACNALLSTKRKHNDPLSRIHEEGEISDKENQSTQGEEDIQDGECRPSKKIRRMEPSFAKPVAPLSPAKDSMAKTLAHNKRLSTAQKTPKSKRGGLSAARLSMLAQPKKRA